MLFKNNQIIFFSNFPQRSSKIISLIFIFLFTFSTPVFSKDISTSLWGNVTEKDRKIIKDVAILIDNKNFDRALERAKDMKLNNYNLYQPLQNIVLWNKYSKSAEVRVSFSDISRFVLDNNYYPNIKNLQDNVERLVVSNSVSKISYESYFEQNKPKNRDTKIYLLEDKISSLRNPTSTNFKEQEAKIKEVQDLVSDIWINSNFTSTQELEFLRKYGTRLSELDHIARIDRQLWEGKFTEINNIILLVNEDYRKLFEAIVKISENPEYINNIILSVPRKLRDDEQLLYRRAVFYNKNKQEDELNDLLLVVPENSKHNLEWWKLRHLQTRELLKQKEYKDAYKIVSNHRLNSQDIEFSDAEWLSGWIALRFLDDESVALKHFQKVYDVVSYPVSVSRAAYWIAMTYQEMGEKSKAIEWYKTASKYPTYFYGQIAITKYHYLKKSSISNSVLPKVPDISKEDINLVSKEMSLKTAYLLALMNDKADAHKIFTTLIERLNSKGQIAAVVRLVEEIGDEEMTYKIYRFANRKDVFFIDKQYKVIKELTEEKNASLLHALIKQESNFSPRAVSVVGAIGLMQVMPETAKVVARKLDIEYSADKLSNDVRYNIKIGSYYINNMLENFDNSKILAIASYNAGPSRTKLWIQEFYDPRDYPISENKDKNLDKMVDWIELITYSETRNYVQRVMENVLVYDYLLGKSNNVANH